MIASLKGKLETLGVDAAIVDVNGVGFLVYMPTSTLSKLGATGSEVKLHTHFHLRADNAALYGFATADELGLFQMLLGVSGLGPRLALAMLSAMDVNQLATAIATANTALLTSVSGIGKKMANRLVLELKDKVSAGWLTAPAAEMAAESEEVLAALTSLGYSAAEATRAVASLPPTAAGESLEEKVKLALGFFGGK
jgi:Holliday junction DNA helicase RuvA